MSKPLEPDDPAYWMLEEGRKDPSKRSVQTAPYRERCYICRDPEFALMGLPLCWACEKCGGHVAADDTRCDDCGHDHQQQEPVTECENGGVVGCFCMVCMGVPRDDD